MNGSATAISSCDRPRGLVGAELVVGELKSWPCDDPPLASSTRTKNGTRVTPAPTDGPALTAMRRI